MVSRMPRRQPALLAAASTASVAFAVHQGRYLLAPDRAADGAHGYLVYAPALLALVTAAALGGLLALLGRAPDAGAGRGRARSASGRWACAWSGLLAVYAVQELAEGHAADVAGRGAWVVLALAAVGALVLAVWLREAPRALTAGARALCRAGGRVPRLTLPAAAAPVLLQVVRRSPAAALAAPGAGRGPPVPVA